MSVYKCSSCDYSTDVKSNCALHVKTKKCEGSTVISTIVYSYCHCGKKFEEIRGLKNHKKICNEKPREPNIDNDELQELKIQLKDLSSLVNNLITQNIGLIDRVVELEKKNKIYDDLLNKKIECEKQRQPGLCHKILNYIPTKWKSEDETIKSFYYFDSTSTVVKMKLGENGSTFGAYLSVFDYVQQRNEKLKKGMYYYDKDNVDVPVYIRTNGPQLYFMKPVYCDNEGTELQESGKLYCIHCSNKASEQAKMKSSWH